MTPLRIDYVPPNAWQWSWLVVAAVVASLAGGFAWKIHALVNAASAATAAMDIALSLIHI